jgi:hypothetical protein
LNTGRQVGTVLGVAGLVAILARVSAADPLPAYRSGIVLVIGFFVAAAAVSAGLLTGRTVPAPEPVAVAAAEPVAGPVPAAAVEADQRLGLLLRG